MGEKINRPSTRQDKQEDLRNSRQSEPVLYLQQVCYEFIQRLIQPLNMTSNRISCDEHVFCGPPETYRPPPGGCGKVFFDFMNLYKHKIHQIEATTGRTQTYDEIRTLSVRVALELRARGVAAGDVVCVCLFNTMDAVLPVLGGLFVGAVVFPLHPNLGQDDFDHLLRLARPKIVFTEVACRDRIAASLDAIDPAVEIVAMDVVRSTAFGRFVAPRDGEPSFEPARVDANADAFVMCSSGTSGAPKGVRITHRAVCAMGNSFSRTGYNFNVTLMYSPLYWISAIMNLAITVFSGTTKIIVEGFNEQSFFDMIEKYRVTFALLNPEKMVNVAKLCDATPRDISSLECIAVGGSAITLDQVAACRRAFGATTLILNVYGLTEFSGPVSMIMKSDWHMLAAKRNTVGKLWAGVQLKIVDPDTGTSLGRNRRGEVCVRSDGMSPGYYRNADDWNGSLDAHGFFMTGDVGYVDDDNCLYIVDRIKFMIKYRGFQISPSDIEEVLLKHADVQETCVLGTPHETCGDLPTAFVVRRPGSSVTEDELIRFVDERVADMKRLRGGVRFLDEIPLTPSGKMKRGHLQNLLKQ